MKIAQIQAIGQALGFNAVGVSNIDLSFAEQRLLDWLAQGYHGDMAWMAHHGTKRSRPAELVSGTLSVISVRMDYLPPDSMDAVSILNHPERAYISRYALGRDYHKVIRQRLEKFAQQLQTEIGAFGYRAFTDSAPVLEKPLAVKAGLGWMGKHTNVLSRDAGSWFFLGEIYTDLPLDETGSVSEHCGQCTACIDVCPTQAILAPYVLDARRCISYLTIEYQGSIPLELRPLMGNRIYGCDDCQLICPWNRFAQTSPEADFAVRNGLDSARLSELFQWSESEFMRKLEGSPIRRIGYERWLRNIAVALGNAPVSVSVMALLQHRKMAISSELVREHIDWALEQQKQSDS
ncbi:MAG: tRNA epoxyqueuosine(34) reductase QueG [Candidatus Thiothrix putei]|uniref:Epoxyqueuosine reductase n=2 Tax=Thiothrix TaxID=1030 RepID=A0A1H3W9G2_9GAMM|nr:tRNA epoxyqueuosine(34) reductase QueG [Thiothrix caldifontis]WGZ95128.1 MAG: tRNA epoxyqueuosine(34) reductase QueG [Candidatus Thiothrix putei]SDZ82982.1 epoxyqueuosine reductase [Thiothrix caldifontis]